MKQIPLDLEPLADLPSDHPEDGIHEVAQDLAYKRLAMVNIVFAGLPYEGDREWTLIDAGVMGTAGIIEEAAADRFGENSRPHAIILTHGHFDHVGALKQLAARWDVPIYAHTLEHPYLNGSAAYPPPDAKAGGGIMPLLSPLFPRGPIDVSQWLEPLPEDGSVPGMPEWRWIHTPGHSTGHVSLWREEDRTLIVGDAFLTTRQESAYAVAMQKPEMHGPPNYFTPDWEAAEASVERLAALEPKRVITGHGRAMRGPAMLAALQELADRFHEVAVPAHSRYAVHPARAADGTAYCKL